MPANDLVKASGQIDTTAVVLMRNPPAAVLAEAARAATALKDVLEKKSKKVMLNGEQYLEFEDWQTLARFYGFSPKEDGDPEFVQFGDVSGFKASAVVLNYEGDAISRATAYCLSDEEKWGTRNKYAWVYCLRDGGQSEEDPGADNIVWEDNPNKPGKKRPKKERVLVGEERVPLYQLASMAQTRACAKALRNVLSWVAVLAGYKPTPAEEMPEDKSETRQDKHKQKSSQQTATPTKPTYATTHQTLVAAMSWMAAKLNELGCPITEAEFQSRVYADCEKVGIKGDPKTWSAAQYKIASQILKDASADIRSTPKPIVTQEQLSTLAGLVEEAQTSWPRVADALKLNGVQPANLTPEQYKRVVDEIRHDISGESKHEEYEDEPADAEVDILF